MTIQYSRLLYPLDEVKYSIIISLLKKYDIEELIYWVCEYYHSGYYLNSWELLHFIFYSFYAYSNNDIGKKINKLYSKWHEECNCMENIIHNNNYSYTSNKCNNRMRDNLYIRNENMMRNNIAMLEDIIYCYKNLYIKKYSNYIYRFVCHGKYNGLQMDKNIINNIITDIRKITQDKKKKNEEIQKKQTDLINNSIPIKFNGKPCKDISVFYELYKKYEIQHGIGNDETGNDETEQYGETNKLFNTIPKKILINLCQTIKHKKFNNINYFMKLFYIIDKNIFIKVLYSIAIYSNIYLDEKTHSIIDKYINTGSIPDFNNMISNVFYDYYYIVGLLYTKCINYNAFNNDYNGCNGCNGSNGSNGINKRSIYIKLNDYYKCVIRYNSLISPFMDICNRNFERVKIITCNKSNNIVVDIDTYEDFKERTEFNNIQSHQILQNSYIYKIPSDVNLFNLNRFKFETHKDFEDTYLYNWIYYVQDTTIWKARLKYYNLTDIFEKYEKYEGYEKLDEPYKSNNSYLELDDKHELYSESLEEFYSNFNYEPDEQTKYTQGHITTNLHVNEINKIQKSYVNENIKIVENEEEYDILKRNEKEMLKLFGINIKTLLYVV